MKKFIVVIPARIASKRLYGKPLIKINGLPMVIRTYFQSLKACNKKLIYIATDSIKIRTVCNLYGAQCILTSNKCLTGTDRVAEVAKKIKADFYINLQGDEPFFNPLDLKKIIKASYQYPGVIINGYTKITDEKMFRNKSIPKVVFDNNKFLIYMSRASIPNNKKNLMNFSYRQVCAYSYPRKELLFFKNLKKKTPLEKAEDLELLRFIENRRPIKMIKMSDKSLSIDTLEDLKIAKKRLNNL